LYINAYANRELSLSTLGVLQYELKHHKLLGSTPSCDDDLLEGAELQVDPLSY
jgi:hypothetical protein